jgi:HEAT repeat protein
LRQMVKSMVSIASRQGVTEDVDALLKEIAAQGNEAVGQLEEVLNSTKNTCARDAAERGLAMIGTQRAAEALFNGLLTESNTTARGILCRSLQVLESPDSAPAAINALTKVANDHTVITSILESIPRIVGSNAVALIVDKYYAVDADEGQRSRLLLALAEVRNPQAVSALVEIAWNDPDAQLRENAAIALGQIGSPEALASLIDLVDRTGATNIQDIVVNSIAPARNKESIELLQNIYMTTTNPLLKAGVEDALKDVDQETPRDD